MSFRCGAAAITATLVLALTACAGRGESAQGAGTCDPGITDTEVNLGMSLPMSGAGAVYGQGAAVAQAYFDDLNADGGVQMADGKQRKVTLLAEDDAYDPAKTVSNVKKLVEQDGVFALYGIIGTSSNLAIADYVKAKGVPVISAQTGSDEIANMHDENPWIIAGLPQYGFEAKAVAKYVLEHKPDGKVAILYQNDGFGKGMLANFQKAFEGTGVTIVSEQSYELTGGSVDSQIVNMQSSGADVFLNYSTGTFMTQSLKKKGELGWNPLTVLTLTASDAATIVAPAGAAGTTGVVSFGVVVDFNDPKNAQTQGVQDWHAFAAEHGYEIANGVASGAWSAAHLLTSTLEATKGCTRQDLIDAAYSLKDVSMPALPEGVTVTTTPDYPYFYTQGHMRVFDGQYWEDDGPLISREDLE